MNTFTTPAGRHTLKLCDLGTRLIVQTTVDREIFAISKVLWVPYDDENDKNDIFSTSNNMNVLHFRTC